MAGPVLETDVLVIGGGMAGAMAALSARASDARVALVRRSPGATAVSSGVLSVGDDPRALPGDFFASRCSPGDAARWIAAADSEHPYARVGEGLGEIEQAIAFAAHELSALIAPPEDRNRWIMTPYGSAIPCALCQRSMAAGDLVDVEGLVAVVGFRGHLGFDARLVAQGIDRLEGLGAPRAEAVEIDLFMGPGQSIAQPFALAQALEAPGAAEAAGELLAKVLPAGAAVALFPPVLGQGPQEGRPDSWSSVPERIAAAAGIAVAETASDVPSVPGLRLQRAIDARLAASGIELLEGEVGPGPAGPGAPLEVAGRSVVAASWILATGRYLPGGIRRRGALQESIFDLPVEVGGWPRRTSSPVSTGSLARRPAASLTDRDERAVQPLFRAGVRVDAQLRPLDLDGRPFHPGLHACGAVLGGHEPAADGTGMGVAILTGRLAGRAAAGKL
jgi:glycerol-3-phosphate dehydrogenase subunit B